MLHATLRDPASPRWDQTSRYAVTFFDLRDRQHVVFYRDDRFACVVAVLPCADDRARRVRR
jgi:hypothetical protein